MRNKRLIDLKILYKAILTHLYALLKALQKIYYKALLTRK